MNHDDHQSGKRDRDKVTAFTDQTIDLAVPKEPDSQVTIDLQQPADPSETQVHNAHSGGSSSDTFDFSVDSPKLNRPQTSSLGTSKSKLTEKLSSLGEYTILKELGRGGMGVVYLGFHQQLHRHVAIKMILGEGLHNQLE